MARLEDVLDLNSLIIPETLRERLASIDSFIKHCEIDIEVAEAKIATAHRAVAERRTERATILEIVMAYQELVPAGDDGGRDPGADSLPGQAAAASLTPGQEQATTRAARRPIRTMILDAIKASPEGATVSGLVTSCETQRKVVNSAIDFWSSRGTVTVDEAGVVHWVPTAAPEPDPEAADPADGLIPGEPMTGAPDVELPPADGAPAVLGSNGAEPESVPAPAPETATPEAVWPYIYYDLEGEPHGSNDMRSTLDGLNLMIDRGFLDNQHDKLIASRQKNLRFLEILNGASPDLHTDLAVKYARAIEKPKPKPPLVAPVEPIEPPPPPPPPVAEALPEEEQEVVAGNINFPAEVREDMVTVDGAEAVVQNEFEEPPVHIQLPPTDRELLLVLLSENPTGLKMVEIGQHGLTAAVVYNAERAGVIADIGGGVYALKIEAAAAE